MMKYCFYRLMGQIGCMGMWCMNAFALPFSVIPSTSLPTMILLNASSAIDVSYTITNTTKFNPPYHLVKWLPPNVRINATGTTCVPTTNFKLAPGQSCTLNLTIMGSVNRNDPNPQHHLMICMSDKSTCAGPTPQNSLNVLSAQEWVSWLKAYSYHVVQGGVYLLESSDCDQFISVFGNCFGNNPASPYIIPQPPIENAYVDPYYAVPFESSGPQGTTDIFYRLSDQDALMTIVSYPPTAAYLGYQSYVFTSQTSNYVDVTPPSSRTVSPNPSRYEIAGSLGNDLNNTIVQNSIGSPWYGNVVMYITTANQYMAQGLLARAKAAGINPSNIFIEPIGSNVITGNGEAADDMVTLIRYAIPENTTDGNNWLSNINNNVLVYKVSQSSMPIARYGSNNYTPHEINNDELYLSTAQSQLVALLQNYLTTAQGTASDNEPTLPTTTINAEGIPSTGLVGSYCIFYGTNCEADNQDTSTYSYLLLSHLGLLETAFIVGVNHSVLNLNNNRYVSVGIYNAIRATGVASSSQTNPSAVGFNSGNLTGSASQVLSLLGISIPPGDTELIDNIDNLYVTFIARDCNNPTIQAANAYCLSLEGISLIPLIAPISITERSYVLPGTTTGGNLNNMLYPIVVAAANDF